MDIFKKLDNSGISKEEFMSKIIFLEVIADVIDSLEMSIEEDFKRAGLFQFENKRSLNQLGNLAKKFVKRFDKEYAKDNNVSSMYGNISDAIFHDILRIIKEEINIK